VGAALALGPSSVPTLDLAEICRSAEQAATGVQTGLLDQLTSLLGAPGEAVLIDFSGPRWRHVPLELDGARLAVMPSGAARELAVSGYNERRQECERKHPARMRHVQTENERVRRAVAALAVGDVAALGPILDESHASLRDDFEVSVPEVERTVAAAKAAGAIGARMVGGGFGGSVLALFGPRGPLPDGAREVRPAAGACRRRDA
jgi:galactokinase